MKKAPFFLYERDKGLVSKEYNLKDFFNKGFLNKYEIRNIGKDFTVKYFSNYKIVILIKKNISMLLLMIVVILYLKMSFL